MGSPEAPEDQTSPLSESVGVRTAHGWVLAILAEGIHRVVSLDRDLVIGRSPTAEVYVNHASLSRHHARVRPPRGPGLSPTIEDLASVNGTRVGGQRIPPGTEVPLTGAEWVELGRVLVTLRTGASTATPRQIWVHDYFESVVEAECARADAIGSHFAVLRFRFAESLPPDALHAALFGMFRAQDIVGYYAPNEYEALVAGSQSSEASTIAEKIVERLTSQGVIAAAGVACYRRDGTTAAELLRHANVASRPAPPAGVIDTTPVGEVDAALARIAVGNISVLVEGETGVGKEITAERIHRASARAGKPLVKVNCAALSVGLMESALFGHMRGAFTGAIERNVGLIASAEGGTLFLDEVGEIPLEMQSKLLRVLEDRIVTPVGATQGRRIDVRFIAATNRDLDTEVAQGSFRADFYYRIAGVTVRVPALRERTHEIESLAVHFLRNAAEALGRPPPALSREALDELRAYAWPGNVRELRNMMERAILLGDGIAILPQHLPLQRMHSVRLAAPLEQHVVDESRVPAVHASLETGPVATLPPQELDAAEIDAELSGRMQEEMDRVERKYLEDALQRAGGLQAEAARLLGVSRRTLINKMERLGIMRPLKHRRPQGS